MLATLLCTVPHHHSVLDDSPVRTTFAPSYSSPSCCSSSSLNDRHADASASSPGSGPSTLPPSSDATATAVSTTATTFITPQKKPTTGSPYRRAPIPMLRKQRRQFSLSLGGGGTSEDKNAACASEQDQDQAADMNAHANASTSSFTVLGLKSTFAFAALRRSGSVSAAGTGTRSNSPSGRSGRWARARLRNASASAAGGGGDKCFVVAEGSEGADTSATKSEKAKAGKAKICIGAPSGFRHEFHLGLSDNPNPSKDMWDEVRWRQVIETRMDTMGVHVGLHENESETLSSLHPDTDAKTQRFVKSVDFSTLTAASTSPSPTIDIPPPGTSAVVAATSLTPTTTPVRPPRNPKRASANTFTGSVTPEQFANLGAKLAAMEVGAGTQVQGVEDALAKLTGTHVRSVSAPGIPEDGILNESPNRSSSAPKAQKRASLVRRKPVPRLDPEEELALGSSSPPPPPPVPPLPSAPIVMSSQSLMQNQQHQHKLKQQRKSVSTYLLIPDMPTAEPMVVARKSLEAEVGGKSAGEREKENRSGRSSLESTEPACDAQALESRTLQTNATPQETQMGSKSNDESPDAQESGNTDASPRPSLSSLSSSTSSSGGESAESGGTEDSEESEAFSTPPMTPSDEHASRDLDTIFGNVKFAAEVSVAEPGNETEGGQDNLEKDVVVVRHADGEELLGSVV